MSQLPVLDHATSFESSLLYALARKARPKNPSSMDFGAISAVILSFTALEAFMNEVGELAETEVQRASEEYRGDVPQVIGLLALHLGVARDNKAPTIAQYELARTILEGERPPDQGARQELRWLAKLRNDLVHMKSERFDICMQPPTEEEREEHGEGFEGSVVSRHKHPAYLRSLESKGLLNECGEETRWLYRVCTAGVAEWACALVELAASEVVECAPADEFREKLENYSLGGRILRQRNPSRFGSVPW